MRLARSNLPSSLARVCPPHTGSGGTTAAPAGGLLRVPSRTAGASRQGAPLRGRGHSKRTRGAVADPRLYGAGCQGKSLIMHQNGLLSAQILLLNQHSTCAHTIQVSGMLIQGVNCVPHLHRHGCRSTPAAPPSFPARASTWTVRASLRCKFSLHPHAHTCSHLCGCIVGAASGAEVGQPRVCAVLTTSVVRLC